MLKPNDNTEGYQVNLPAMCMACVLHVHGMCIACV